MIVRMLYVVNAVVRFKSMSTLDNPNATTKASKAMQIRLNVSGGGFNDQVQKVQHDAA